MTVKQQMPPDLEKHTKTIYRRTSGRYETDRVMMQIRFDIRLPTGWAQVNGLRGETSTTDKMRQRVQYDLDYLKNWSFWLDLKIIASTVLIIFNDRNAY
jgi:lipopolysaccharide/colanic/teichoic acid biosynthesis glycosyltransferase